jgi:hypothetical protein
VQTYLHEHQPEHIKQKEPIFSFLPLFKKRRLLPPLNSKLGRIFAGCTRKNRAIRSNFLRRAQKIPLLSLARRVNLELQAI